MDVLRSYLSGDAKGLIGTHFTDIEEALKTLVEYFGHPDRIWESKLSKIKTLIVGDSRTYWGSENSQKRVMAISQLIEFLKETIKTAETYKELEYDIFNKYTFRPIFKSIPRDIHGRFVRNVSDPSMNIKDKVKELATFLESERSHALEGLKDLGDDTSKEKKSYDSRKGNDGKKVHYADGDDSDNDNGCKYCNGKSCKLEWDALGCLEIYKMQMQG